MVSPVFSQSAWQELSADSGTRRDLGLDIFHHSVLSDEQIASRVTSSLLALIEMERYIKLISAQCDSAS
jgi:hypothetical protein